MREISQPTTIDFEALVNDAAEMLELDPDHWNRVEGQFRWGEAWVRYHKSRTSIYLTLDGRQLKVERFNLEIWR